MMTIRRRITPGVSRLPLHPRDRHDFPTTSTGVLAGYTQLDVAAAG